MYGVRTRPICQSDLAPDAQSHLGLAPDICFPLGEEERK